MKKIVTLSILSLGVLFLAGCGQQQVVQNQSTVPTPTPVAQQKEQPINQVTIPTETLNYCGRSFVAEKVEINGVDIVNRILQLSIAKDKDNCINFEQIENIAVLKTVEGSTTSITLYESKSLTEADRQLPAAKQLEKISSNEKYPSTNEYIIKRDSIYVISKFDGSEQLLGKLK